VQVILLFF
jgi:hypothetical protein